MTWTRVAAQTEVDDDRAVRIHVDGRAVCLVHTEGDFFALDDRCSHAEIALSEGEVEEGRIECWLHGSQFDVRTGEPLGLPATVPVATYAVKVVGDDVYVSLEEKS